MPLDFIPQVADPVLKSLGIHSDEYRADYSKIAEDLKRLKRTGERDEYLKIIRTIAPQDFFFFCYFVLDLPVNHPFLVARVYEIQDDPYDCLDLWAREHWKSTLLSYAMPLWELIRNPNERICIFSHTRSIAKALTRRIKFAMESNEDLKDAFPKVFYKYPKRDAPKWSEDEGLYVKRRRNFNEASIECSGLVDGMPTSKHYTIRIYDDTVTEKAVSTPAQTKKVADCLKLSENLGERNGRKRYIGTRYSNSDPYDGLIKIGVIKVRTYPAEVDEHGDFKIGGIPVYLTREELDRKLTEMGEYIYSAQMGQHPSAKSFQQFTIQMLRHYSAPEIIPQTLNKLIIADPARKVGVEYDYTVIQVWGLSARREYWMLDMVRDKIPLGDRWRIIRDFGQKYETRDLAYETLGNTDLDYLNERQEAEGIYFNIIELKGNMSKHVKIGALHPLFKAGRIILPKVLVYKDILDQPHNLIYEFIYEEFVQIPYSAHDDMLDCMSRLLDRKVQDAVPFPSLAREKSEMKRDEYDPFTPVSEYTGRTWMSE